MVSVSGVGAGPSPTPGGSESIGGLVGGSESIGGLSGGVSGTCESAHLFLVSAAFFDASDLSCFLRAVPLIRVHSGETYIAFLYSVSGVIALNLSSVFSVTVFGILGTALLGNEYPRLVALRTNC